MANGTKAAGVSDGKSSVVIQDQQTYLPQLSVANMERLYKLNPEFANFYIKYIDQEAAHKRARDKKMTKGFFIRTAGQVSASLIALISIVGGSYIVYSNPDAAIAGAIIAVVPVSGLATTLIIGRHWSAPINYKIMCNYWQRRA